MIKKKKIIKKNMEKKSFLQLLTLGEENGNGVKPQLCKKFKVRY